MGGRRAASAHRAGPRHRPSTRTGAHLLPTHDRRELAAIFVINVAGAFLLGYFITRLQERLPTSAYKRPFLGTGLCGALTTFSTVQLELFKMVQAHVWGLAIAYAVVTVACSFAAIAAATAMVRRVRMVL
jgi:fluoride exporter